MFGTELDEAQLVAQISQGDQQAFKILLDKHLPPISRYVKRMLGTQTETEDIAQEVFLRLWTQSEKFNPSVATLTTWLHNIAHNLCIDLFRKTNRYVDDEVFPEIESGDNPDIAFMQKIEANEVKGAIMKLPERQRSALILCHYQGMSNRDAAITLDVSIDALESLLSRGRRNLKGLLKECFSS